jgi:hypothetical protein
MYFSYLVLYNYWNRYHDKLLFEEHIPIRITVQEYSDDNSFIIWSFFICLPTLVISFVTCVFSDQFAKGVCQVHVLLMSCYFNHVGNFMSCVSYIVLNLVWARLSVFTSKIFSYLLKNPFNRWDKYLNIIDLIVTNVWGYTISEYKLQARV